MKFRKKPVVIEAFKWEGSNGKELGLWHEQTAVTELSSIIENGDSQTLTIPTLEGDMTAQIGDYIICGVKGEYYPCKPDIFEATYEEVLED